jgi:hypothetical protein
MAKKLQAKNNLFKRFSDRFIAFYGVRLLGAF